MPAAKAAKVTIVEVEEIVETGAIPAEDVHLPSIYVQRVHKGLQYQKRIEVREHNVLVDLGIHCPCAHSHVYMSVKAVLKNGCYMYMYVHVHCV